MEKLAGVFIGYKNFTSKKNGKSYFVISFVFLVPDEVNQGVSYFIKDLFVSEKEYSKFVKENKLLSSVEVSREIVNDQIRYYI